MSAWVLAQAGSEAQAAAEQLRACEAELARVRAAGDGEALRTLASRRLELDKRLARLLRPVRARHRDALRRDFFARIGRTTATQTYRLRCEAVDAGLGWATANAVLGCQPVGGGPAARRPRCVWAPAELARRLGGRRSQAMARCRPDCAPRDRALPQQGGEARAPAERSHRRTESFVAAALARRLSAPRIHVLSTLSNPSGGRAGLAALLGQGPIGGAHDPDRTSAVLH
jgi:hypothetical protein